MVKKQGGKRKGAGRKPLEDKKVQVQIYIPQSWVTTLGIERCKFVCYDELEKRMKKI